MCVPHMHSTNNFKRYATNSRFSWQVVGQACYHFSLTDKLITEQDNHLPSPFQIVVAINLDT